MAGRRGSWVKNYAESQFDLPLLSRPTLAADDNESSLFPSSRSLPPGAAPTRTTTTTTSSPFTSMAHPIRGFDGQDSSQPPSPHATSPLIPSRSLPDSPSPTSMIPSSRTTPSSSSTTSTNSSSSSGDPSPHLPPHQTTAPPPAAAAVANDTSPNAGPSVSPTSSLAYRPSSRFVSSPLNPLSPGSPFARPGSRGSVNHIARIASEESRVLSGGGGGPTSNSSSLSSRGSMILYRRAEDHPPSIALSGIATPHYDEHGSLLPPNPFASHNRSSMISTSGDSVLSLSSDSKYPHGMNTPERGLVAYAYDPAIDESDAPNDEDLLHDPSKEDVPHGKGYHKGIPWRGITNIAALVVLILALLALFVVYPMIRFYNDNGRNNMIVGNTVINATGQAMGDGPAIGNVGGVPQVPVPPQQAPQVTTAVTTTTTQAVVVTTTSTSADAVESTATVDDGTGDGTGVDPTTGDPTGTGAGAGAGAGAGTGTGGTGTGAGTGAGAGGPGRGGAGAGAGGAGTGTTGTGAGAGTGAGGVQRRWIQEILSSTQVIQWSNWVDTATPLTDRRRGDAQGGEYRLVFSDEFLGEGDGDGEGEDSATTNTFWESLDQDSYVPTQVSLADDEEGEGYLVLEESVLPARPGSVSASASASDADNKDNIQTNAKKGEVIRGAVLSRIPICFGDGAQKVVVEVGLGGEGGCDAMVLQYTSDGWVEVDQDEEKGSVIGTLDLEGDVEGLEFLIGFLENSPSSSSASKSTSTSQSTSKSKSSRQLRVDYIRVYSNAKSKSKSSQQASSISCYDHQQRIVGSSIKTIVLDGYQVSS